MGETPPGNLTSKFALESHDGTGRLSYTFLFWDGQHSRGELLKFPGSRTRGTIPGGDEGLWCLGLVYSPHHRSVHNNDGHSSLSKV